MHPSAMNFATSALGWADVEGRTVAECGSFDMNGSVRPHIENLSPASYLGIDLRKGPCVDEVADAADLPAFGTFDVVISTEMLEHARDWQGAFRGMITALSPGGLLVITTRSKGFPRHDFPGDYWRYSLADMRAIIEGAGLEIARLENDPEAAGVFVKARKPFTWSWPQDAGWQHLTLETP